MDDLFVNNSISLLKIRNYCTELKATSGYTLTQHYTFNKYIILATGGPKK